MADKQVQEQTFSIREENLLFTSKLPPFASHHLRVNIYTAYILLALNQLQSPKSDTFIHLCLPVRFQAIDTSI